MITLITPTLSTSNPILKSRTRTKRNQNEVLKAKNVLTATALLSGTITILSKRELNMPDRLNENL